MATGKYDTPIIKVDVTRDHDGDGVVRIYHQGAARPVEITCSIHHPEYTTSLARTFAAVLELLVLDTTPGAITGVILGRAEAIPVLPYTPPPTPRRRPRRRSADNSQGG